MATDKRKLIYERNHGVRGPLTPLGKSREPADAYHVFVANAIEGPPVPPKQPNFYGIGQDGDMYRYCVSGNTVHWNGRTGPPDMARRIRQEDIPGEIKAALEWDTPQGR